MKLLPITAALCLLTTPALAQEGTPCKPLDKMRADLASQYQEVLTGIGRTLDGNMLMQFQSKDGATYTVVLVSPRKVACIMEFGTDWQTRSDPAPDQERGS
jgi:hypothetical protein